MFIRLKNTAIATMFISLLSLSAKPVQAAPTKQQNRRPVSVAPVRTAPASNRPTQGNTVVTANPALNSAYNAYLNSLRPRIDNQWWLVDGNNHVTLSMSVGTDGGVTELEITSSPKSTEAEQAASDAFNKVQPLPALPSGSGAIKLTLTFDSRASQHENERHLSGRIDAPGSTTTASHSSSSSDNSSSSTSSSSSSSGSSGSSSDSESTTTESKSETSSGK